MRLYGEVVDMATILFSLWEWTMKRKNFPFYVMTFLHCLAEIKDMEDFGATIGIL